MELRQLPLVVVLSGALLTGCSNAGETVAPPQSEPTAASPSPEESANQPEPSITAGRPSGSEDPEAGETLEAGIPSGNFATELTDADGYTFTSVIDYSLLPAYADPKTDKPGFTTLVLPMEVTFRAINTTPGRETTAPIGYSSLWAQYPAQSSVCALRSNVEPDGTCWAKMASGAALALGDVLEPNGVRQVTLDPETEYNLAPQIRLSGVSEKAAASALQELGSPSQIVGIFDFVGDEVPIVDACKRAALIGSLKPVECDLVDDLAGRV